MSEANDSSHPSDSVSLQIAAPPERCYEIVTDIANMGQLSPECVGGTWLGGASGPAVGAEFKGRNKRGIARWSTRNKVVAADPGREFAFQTKQSGTEWRYRFEPADGGTLVTESRAAWRDRPLIAKAFAGRPPRRRGRPRGRAPRGHAGHPRAPQGRRRERLTGAVQAMGT
jgi:hypothetical protein